MKHQIKARLKVALLNKEKITPIKALKRWGCFRLAVYIQRLRAEGMKISTELIGKQRYAQYSLIKNTKQ